MIFKNSAILLGAAVFLATATAYANPFASTSDKAYVVAEAGEAKCGANMPGTAKCGAKKMDADAPVKHHHKKHKKDAEANKKMMEEGKCGEGKCGAKNLKEGKCGK